MIDIFTKIRCLFDTAKYNCICNIIVLWQKSCLSEHYVVQQNKIRQGWLA